jgi:AcrR family transcriptional regulator
MGLASNRTVRYACGRNWPKPFGCHGDWAVPLTIKVNEETFTPRQQAVLTAALDLLVENGDGLTMTAVARRASCSKETLYKWFGDRDGLLTATVQWQAAKVRMPVVDRSHLNAKALRLSIEQFARDLLTVITGEVSVTLNRTAVTHAAQEKDSLGIIVLENGPLAIRRRLKPILEAGRDARLLRFDSSEDAYRTFFGLVVRDVQIRLLLGDKSLTQSNVEANIEADVKAATDQFFALYGAKANP